ncbi:hypothetical protein B566_EDAN005368, partial [Ephemera danica]
MNSARVYQKSSAMGATLRWYAWLPVCSSRTASPQKTPLCRHSTNKGGWLYLKTQGTTSKR